MENQINVSDQNSQQNEQRPVNQSTIAPKNSKTNYLMIVGIVLVCFLLFGFGGYYLGRQSGLTSNTPASQPTQQTLPSPSPVNSKITANESPSSDVTANWKTYKFADYPFEFKFPGTLTLKEKPDSSESKFVIGLYDGDVKIMTIRPEQQGIGFENPDIEITTVQLTVDGKPVIMGNKELQKTKLYNKAEKTTTYVVMIHYPDERSYSIMIPSFFNDNSENKQLSDAFDRIISTIKFTN